jgi:choline-sulfatase
MAERPNVLLIMTDMQRHDALACYGNVFVETPNIDRLARSGTRFERCFTPFPLCTPARATLWTGLYPHAHRVIGNVYGIDNAFARPDGTAKLVFDHLHEAGYVSAYIGKWHLGERNPGCFDEWFAHNSLGGHWVDGRQAMQGGRYAADHETDKGIAFLKSRKKAYQPFVMVQSYYPPHGPYTVPEEYHLMYRDKGIPYPGYYAACTAIDANVGRLRSALEDYGLAENTVIIYLSDHGTTFEARDGSYHARVCYDDSVRVPLIIRPPSDTGNGKACNAIVGLQDIAPTILDMCNCPIPDTMHGRSLLPWLDGAAPCWRDCYYFENTLNAHLRTVSFVTKDMRVVGPLTQRAVRTHRWKLILSEGGPHELYDLSTDPDELLNLYGVPCDDEHDQYRHFEPHDQIVHELAGRMKDEADAIGDEQGATLAQAVCDQQIQRYDWNVSNATGLRL